MKNLKVNFYQKVQIALIEELVNESGARKGTIAQIKDGIVYSSIAGHVFFLIPLVYFRVNMKMDDKFKGFDKLMDEVTKNATEELTATGKIIKGEDVANCVEFACDKFKTYVNGRYLKMFGNPKKLKIYGWGEFLPVLVKDASDNTVLGVMGTLRMR